MAVVCWCFPVKAFAASFTEILNTSSFAGTWEWVDKFSFFGAFLQFVISACCVLGLCGIMFRVMVTFLYLANRTFFNEVHEVKEIGTQGGDGVFGAFGILPMWKEVAQGKRGSGVDAIVGWFMTLMPDVKKYSDYSDDAKGYSNLDAETDTIGRYVLNTFIPITIAVFFFTMGFNGTLFQAYGTIVDGMAVVGERLVNVNLEGAVARAIDSGENYSFSYSTSETNLGSLQQKVAQSMYLQILGRSEELDANYRMTVGKSIEEWVNSNVTQEKMNDYIKSTLSTVQADNIKINSDEDLRGIKYDLIINTSEKNTSGGKDVGVSVPISTFTKDAGGSSNYYMHIVFTKDRLNSGGYFTIKDKDK